MSQMKDKHLKNLKLRLSNSPKLQNSLFISEKSNFRKTGDLNTGSYIVELYNLTNSYLLSFIAIFIIFHIKTRRKYRLLITPDRFSFQ